MITFELQVSSKICKFVSLYWSLSQTSGRFEKFTDTFELTLDTLAKCKWHLIIVLGDFNMRSRTLYIIDKTTTENAKIGVAASKYKLHQFINISIHVLENLLFCTDLIFTPQTNLVQDSSVHSSLHPNYYHQIKTTRNMALRAREHWTY